ncbi:hypothetical protein CMV_018062 [Castanea mollissima]|uniref:Uncharacterized protein n=1 Tax=Castanea mollissima TaxID=60419 RepID=A0A8J4QS31_9ROSI|nr:hypothetical protein CMV_018062 [Castanea mollissima]
MPTNNATDGFYSFYDFFQVLYPFFFFAPPTTVIYRQRTSQLARSVEFYQRHVFLCYKNPQVWPSKIEASEFDQVPRLLFAAFKARKADMNKENYKFYPICKQSPKAIKTSVRHIEKKER